MDKDKDMNKIKAILRKFQSTLTINMNKRPLVMTLIILFVINLLILCISSAIATIIAPEQYPNFITAFAKGSIKWMISTNSINTLEGGYQIMLLAGTVVIIEIVLFSGTIIALTTNGLKTYFTKKTQAKGKLILENHLVILNWNSKVTEILNDLRYKGEKITVLVLSDRDKDYVKNQITSSLLKDEEVTKAKLNLVVRLGDPFSRSDLEDICIYDARSIIIMAEEYKENIATEVLSQTDLNSLKLLLLIGTFNTKPDCNIVVEVESYNTETMLTDLTKTVNSLNGKKISSISFNRKLGQILAQTVFQPKLASVYVDLLSFKGAEFYSTALSGIEDYLANYTDSIPIIGYEKLFVLSTDEENLNRKRAIPYHTDRRLIKSIGNEMDAMTLFVIGDNKKSKYMLENLSRTEKEIVQFNIKTFKKTQNDELVIEISKTEGEKVILILSDDNVSSEVYDANVFYTLIHLHNNFHNAKSLSYITEILDPRNLRTVKDFNVNNAIVSNRLISLIITQMATNADSKRFYEELLLIDNEEEEGFDIKIDNTEELLDMKQDLTFMTRAELVNSFYYSFDKKFMLIGIIKNDVAEYLSDDLDKAYKITLNYGDQLIYIKY